MPSHRSILIQARKEPGPRYPRSKRNQENTLVSWSQEQKLIERIEVLRPRLGLQFYCPVPVSHLLAYGFFQSAVRPSNFISAKVIPILTSDPKAGFNSESQTMRANCKAIWRRGILVVLWMGFRNLLSLHLGCFGCLRVNLATGSLEKQEAGNSLFPTSRGWGQCEQQPYPRLFTSS
jgi:hypothetical protein